jgi:elongation factor Ts
MMKNDPKMAWKPDEVLLKIIEWKIGKFKAEISLLEQDFVVDPSKKVKNFIGESSLVAFYRFKI